MSIDNLIFLLNWNAFLILMLISLLDLVRFVNRRPLYFIPYNLFGIFGILIGTFGFISADWLGYVDMIERLRIWGKTLSVEPIYWQLADWTNYNIFEFRFILFIIYFILFRHIIKIFNLPQTITCLIFVILLLFSVISVIRSSVADVVMWTGIFVFYRKKSFLTFICLCLLSTLGIVMHKSSFMIVLLFMLSYFPLKKICIEISIICIPLVIFIVRILVPMIFTDFFEESTYNQPQIINSTIGSLKFVTGLTLSLIFGIFILRHSYPYCKESFISKMYKIYYWGFYIWFVFLFSGASRFVGERFLAHASIPMLFIVIYFFLKAPSSKKKNLWYLLCAYTVFTQLAILVVWAYHLPDLISNEYI